MHARTCFAPMIIELVRNWYTTANMRVLLVSIKTQPLTDVNNAIHATTKQLNCPKTEANSGYKSASSRRIVHKPVSSSLKLSYAEQSDSLCDVGASSSAN